MYGLVLLFTGACCSFHKICQSKEYGRKKSRRIADRVFRWYLSSSKLYTSCNSKMGLTVLPILVSAIAFFSFFVSRVVRALLFLYLLLYCNLLTVNRLRRLFLANRSKSLRVAPSSGLVLKTSMPIRCMYTCT